MMMATTSSSKSPFRPQWKDSDGKAFSAAHIAAQRAPRAWERQAQSPFDRKKGYKKVWRRYNLRKRGDALEPMDDGKHDTDPPSDSECMAHRTPARVVKKRRAGSTGPDVSPRKRVQSRATKWDRRKSGLPRKQASLLEAGHGISAPEVEPTGPAPQVPADHVFRAQLAEREPLDNAAAQLVDDYRSIRRPETRDNEVPDETVDTPTTTSFATPQPDIDERIEDESAEFPDIEHSEMDPSETLVTAVAADVTEPIASELACGEEMEAQATSQVELERPGTPSEAEDLLLFSPVGVVDADPSRGPSDIYSPLPFAMSAEQLAPPETLLQNGTSSLANPESEHGIADREHNVTMAAFADSVLTLELLSGDDKANPNTTQELSEEQSASSQAASPAQPKSIEAEHSLPGYEHNSSLIAPAPVLEAEELIDAGSMGQATIASEPAIEDDNPKMDSIVGEQVHANSMRCDQASSTPVFAGMAAVLPAADDPLSDPTVDVISSHRLSATGHITTSMPLEVSPSGLQAAPNAEGSGPPSPTSENSGETLMAPDLATDNDEDDMMSDDGEAPGFDDIADTIQLNLSMLADRLTDITDETTESTNCDTDEQALESDATDVPGPSIESEDFPNHLDADTAHLMDFLNRAAASKQDGPAVIARRSSLQNRRDSDAVRHALASPRKPLEDKDVNSPLSRRTGDEGVPQLKGPLTSPSKEDTAAARISDPELQESESSPRRSTRSRRRSSGVTPGLGSTLR